MEKSYPYMEFFKVKIRQNDFEKRKTSPLLSGEVKNSIYYVVLYVKRVLFVVLFVHGI